MNASVDPNGLFVGIVASADFDHCEPFAVVGFADVDQGDLVPVGGGQAVQVGVEGVQPVVLVPVVARVGGAVT